jgi:hypothetical protein
MVASHRAHVEDLLSEAAVAHRDLVAAVPQDVAAALPVDAQGITQAIDYLADALGFSGDQRRRLVLPHAINPAVMHARVFGASQLTPDTVIGAFVEGARVRAEALLTVAEALHDDDLIQDVRGILIDHPLPVAGGESTEDSASALRDAYSAQEAAVLLIAARLDSL